MTECAFTPPKDQRHWLHAISGMLETTLVVIVSIVAAVMVQRAWTPSLAEALGLAGGATQDFVAASAAIGVQFAAQYGAMAALIVVLGVVRGRNRLRHYGIAAPQGGWPNAIGSGVIAGLLVGVIPALVFILQDVAPIGEDTPIWAALRNARWDWTYWLFMAVGSFAVPPIIEELAWRGYVLGRLGEGFAPGAALVMTTLVFSALHFQYLRPDAAMALTLVGLVLASLAFGFLTLRSGSLAPAIIAHAIINFPLPTEGNIAKIALAFIALFAFRHSIAAEAKAWLRIIWRASTLAVAPAVMLIAAAAVAAMQIPNGLYWIGGGAILLLAILLMLKRSAWR